MSEARMRQIDAALAECDKEVVKIAERVKHRTGSKYSTIAIKTMLQSLITHSLASKLDEY